MELNVEQMKDWVQELVLRNRILEEENKSLKLKNPGHSDGQEQEDLHSKILVLENEVKFLKLNNLELTERLKNTSTSVKDQGEGLQSSNDRQIPADVEQTNPLMIEEIMRLVLCHVKPLDLLNCRQVCRLWRSACRKSIEEKMTFHISRHDVSEIRLFMDHAAHSFPKFRNLKLDLDCDNWTEKDVRALFQNHGKYLHKLQLNYKGSLVNNWVEDYFRSVFLDSLQEVRDLQIYLYCEKTHESQTRRSFPPRVKQTLPNLVTLNLGLDCTGCRPFEGFNEDRDVYIFSDILEMTPNVQTIHWRSWKFDKNPHDGSNDFIGSLLNVNPPKLESLFIHSFLGHERIESIRDSKLKLKQLYIMDYVGFRLHLVSSPSTKSTFTPKPGSQRFQTFHGSNLKINLEEEFAKYENVSCTRLLQVFTTTLQNHR